MLRINLLPIRQLKKRAKARNQIVAFGMVLGATILVMGFIGMLQSNRVDNVNAAIAELKREQQKLAPIIAEVDRLTREKKDLQNKIDIIQKLRKESSLTVHVIDEVANLVDSSRMWLTGLTQKGNSLKVQGIALDNQTVAQLMENLKESDYIADVSLQSSTLKKISGRDFKTFVLACIVEFPTDETDATSMIPQQ